jgi:hypothetical protein
MKLLNFFSTLLSKKPAEPQPAPRPAAQAPASAPAGQIPWTPRPVPRGPRKAAAKGKNPGPPAAARMEPPAAKTVAPMPPIKPPAPPQAPAQPHAQAQPQPQAAQARAAEPRPPVPTVGARGETDLEPSRASVAAVNYPSAQSSGDDVDRAAIKELFSDIAAGQAVPVKNFIGDLRARNATAEWLQVCRPVMAVLHESATQLGLMEAAGPMGEFISALDLAAEGQEGKDAPIDGAARDMILETYDALGKILPEVFGAGAPVSRRDSMLLHAILSQVPGVGVVTFDALYGIGLTSLATLRQASAEDLQTTAGIPAQIAQAVWARVREHEAEIERTAHLPAERRYSERLVMLLGELIKEHETFVVLSDESGYDETRGERKRAARRDRNLCALKIEATLIEMEAVECADALRVLPFDRRIEHMEKFLGVRVAKRAAEQR